MMIETETLSARLKASTDDLHRHAESRQLQKLMAAGELPRAAYVRYLSGLAPIHRAMEDALRNAADSASEVGAMWSEVRAHAGRLEADLDALEAGPDDRAIRPATESLLGEIANAAASEPGSLIGAFYVLEGSMNGNRFLARVLGRAYGIDADSGLSYFDPYGEAQRERWMEFRDDLDGLSLDESKSAKLIEQARVMFEGIAAISDEALASTTE